MFSSWLTASQYIINNLCSFPEGSPYSQSRRTFPSGLRALPMSRDFTLSLLLGTIPTKKSYTSISQNAYFFGWFFLSQKGTKITFIPCPEAIPLPQGKPTQNLPQPRFPQGRDPHPGSSFTCPRFPPVRSRIAGATHTHTTFKGQL